MIDNPFHPANRIGLTPANASIWDKIEGVAERQAIADEVERGMQIMLDALCIDTKTDPNTQDTAKRVSRMMVNEVCRGRFMPPPAVTCFPNTKKLDEMQTVGPIAIRSLCSHHFCPVLGQAWVGYIPGELLAGLSKFSRIVDWFAARPQLQEEMVSQIADFLDEKLKPKGVAVVVQATHTCMTWRGVREHPEAQMTTSVMRGVFREKPEARAEFLAFARR